MTNNPILFNQAQSVEFLDIARLIVEQNKNPERHCIQSASSEEPQDVYNEMVSLDQSSELCFVVARQEGQLIGALGGEFDPMSGRSWLRGPFVLAETDEWDGIASRLLQEFLACLPPTIRRADSFLNMANERGNRFYLSQGFRRIQLVHVYNIWAAEAPPAASEPCLPVQPEQAEAFAALHNTIFPKTYATGERLLAQIDDNHQAFVYTHENQVLGYVYAMIEGSPEGVIEYIGVKPEARGQGIGRQLLLAALQWLFEVKKVPQVSLTVNDDLANARSLYEKVGFRFKYTGVHTRKDW